MSEFDRSIAVVIGINNYERGIPPLGTAANDARRLGQLLQDHHGYSVNLILDQDATGTRIAELFGSELKPGPDDRVLFYFAGHGVALDGEDGPNGYLLPQDARRDDPGTFIRMPWLNEALNGLNCRHLLVILDSCFGGAFRWSATTRGMRKHAVMHKQRYDRFVHDPAWQVITSASHDQTALDALTTNRFGERGDRNGHSPFALALFEALSGKAEAGSDEQRSLLAALASDGVITATELYLYLEDVLQTETLAAGARQTPRLWPLKKHDKGEYIFHVPGHAINLPDAPTPNYKNNPYRGLKSFEKEDAPIFFGREAVIEELNDFVQSKPLTVVLGASGTGKSSVVKAGLLPKLERDIEQLWEVLPVMRPGKTPFDALVKTLEPGPVTGDNPGSTSAETRVKATGDPDPSTTRANTNPADLRTPDSAASETRANAIETLIADRLRASPTRKLVLVIDQFEELVTMTRQNDRRTAFLGLLSRITDRHSDRLRVIVTVRTDFEPQFSGTILKSRWMQGRYIVPSMSREDLRQVIEEPASLKVLYFKPSGLVERLVDEVANTPGGLPLLSFALSEMYMRFVNRGSDDRSLTEEDYEALGGVVGALRSRADEELNSLDPQRQKTMRRIMLRMVSVEGGNVARQRVRMSELDYPDEAETERAGDVVERLTDARLLVGGREDDGEPCVEPAHDALVRAWDKIIGWIHEEETRPANLHFQQSLAVAALEWEQSTVKGARAGLLWRDTVRGSLLSRLVGREEDLLPFHSLPIGARFLRRLRHLGLRARKSAKPDISETWMNRRELAFGRRSIRRRRNINFGLAFVGLLILAGAISVTILGLESTRLGRLSVERELDATAGLLAINSTDALRDRNLTRAMLLGAEGIRLRPTIQGRNALMRSVQNSATLLAQERQNGFIETGYRPDTLVFSTDGKRLLVAGGAPSLWQLEAEPVALPLPEPDSLVVPGRSGGVLRWDVDGFLPVVRGLGQTRIIAFSSARKVTVYADADWVVLWRGGIVDSFQTVGTVTSLDVSADGNLLAIGGLQQVEFDQAGYAQVWQIAGSLPPRPVSEPVVVGNPVYQVDVLFAPVGTRLLLHWHFQFEDALKVSRFVEGTSPQLLSLGCDVPESDEGYESDRLVAFATNGARLAVYGVANSKLHIRVCDTSDGNLVGSFEPVQEVRKLTFSPTGNLVTFGNRVVRQLDPATGRDIGEPLAMAEVSSDFSAAGRLLAVGEIDGFRVVETRTSTFVSETLLPDEGTVSQVAISRDGKQIAIGLNRGVKLWEVTSAERIVVEQTSSSDPELVAESLRSFSPTSTDSTLGSWQARTRVGSNDPGGLAPDSILTGMTISNITANGARKRVAEFDCPPVGSDRTGRYRWGGCQVARMTLSPDHRLLALDSFTTEPVYAYDGDYAYVRNIREVHSLRLISEQADSETFTPFDEQEGPFSPAFSPDGSRLATGNGLQVTLWSTSNVVDSLRLVPDRPLLHSGPVSTLGFSPDGNLLAVGGTNDNAGFVQLWRMEAYPPQAFGESIAFDQPVTQVAFGTDTVYIASGGRVVGLNLDPDWWLTRACEMLNRNLTQTEWDAVLPGRDYACTCNKRPPGDGTGLTDCSGS